MEANQLTGELIDHGVIELQRIDSDRFVASPAPDCAAEFELEIVWQHGPKRWVWVFAYGLRGTRSKAGERRWELTRKGEEFAASTS